MTSPLSALSPLLPAAPPPAKAAGNGDAGNEATPFARELSRAQDTEPQAQPAARNSKPPARGKAAADPADAAAPSTSEAGTPASRSTDAGDADAADPEADGKPAGDVSALINNLLGLATPPAPPAGTAATAGPATDAGEAAATVGAAGEGGGGHGALPLPAAPDAAARTAGASEVGGDRRGPADTARPSTTDLQSPVAELRAAASAEGPVALPASVDPLARSGAEPPTVPAAAVPPAAGTGVPAAALIGASPATTPFEARLSAALGSPDFAPAFGHQVRVLVQDGVQHARLHLNPADMGPITVQIALDGLAAMVHLAAEQPLTRQALEQAMPVLASALREGGLTLSGGGVFEQPRDPQQDGSGAPAGGAQRRGDGQADDRSAGAPATVATRRLRGAVDLIA